MKVDVDRGLCALTGNCVMTAPNVFRFEGDELVYDSAPPESEHEATREAAMLCPLQAITVEE